VEDDSIITLCHESPTPFRMIIVSLLSPVMGREEDSLEAWHVQRVRDADGVNMASIILDVELESAHPFDNHT